MSSNKLNVAKIPANIPLSYFQGIFAQLPGFKSAHYMFTPDKQQISHGVVEFASPEHAQEAIRLAQGYRIPGSSEPLYLYLDDVQGVQGYPYSLKQQQSQQQQSQQHPKMVQMVAGGHQLRPGQGFQQAGQLQYPGGRMPMQQMVYMDSMMKQNQGKSFPGGEMDPNHSMVAGMHPQYAQQTMGVIPHMQPQELEYGKMFQVPQEATNCLYIEGVPIDSKEREVARKFDDYRARYLPAVSRLHLCPSD